MNTTVENGKITGTMLGTEDHGIMTFYLFIEFEKDGRIFMTGPVVYIGKITVAEQFFA